MVTTGVGAAAEIGIVTLPEKAPKLLYGGRPGAPMLYPADGCTVAEMVLEPLAPEVTV
jgi:hypothetical protein